jgi:thiamine-monophosphate kinase
VRVDQTKIELDNIVDELNRLAIGDPKIKDIGEFEFIRSIKDGCHFFPEKLIKGIGDDCAVIGPYEEEVFLITTDLLVEDVHFILGKIRPEHLGQKAVAVNFSDIAAMGGKALHLFFSLAIPESMRLESLYDIYRGIKAICKQYQVNILGGDTSMSPDRLVINITVIGKAPEKEVLYRSGARPGDAIFVTGTLGDSAAGLKLIKEEASAPEHLASTLKAAHDLPVPFLEAGRIIAQSRLASAMIDLSDGLVSDLRHICEASGVSAILSYEDLPLSKELKGLAEFNKFDPHELALSGGEDYKLLITVPQGNSGPFQEVFEKGTPCHVYRVGEIAEGKGIKMVRPDGMEEQLQASGFDHFKRA